MAKPGHPTDYEEAYDELAYKFCLLGATDAQLGEFFGVTEQTINNWKHAHDSFFESILNGKARADAEVADRLFQRAKGYEHDEDKIFQYEGTAVVVPTRKYYPPDTQAASLWLRNRQPSRWRDKQELEVGAVGPMQVFVVTGIEGAPGSTKPELVVEIPKE